MWCSNRLSMKETCGLTYRRRQSGLKALQIAEERREGKVKRGREIYTQLPAEFQRTARRDKEAFLDEQCTDIGKNNRM